MTLATVDLRSLSRTQQRRIADAPEQVAEEIVAEVVPNAKHRPDEAEWYDVVKTTTGTKYEAKSTWTEIGQKYPAGGRFRLRRDQLRSLQASINGGGDGSAWVAFVLFDEEEGAAKVRRAKPSTVAGWIEDRGGWNESGHDDFQKQHKLPYSVVFV